MGGCACVYIHISIHMHIHIQNMPKHICEICSYVCPHVCFWSQFLQEKGIRAKFYHADMDLYGVDSGGNSGRMEVYAEWSDGRIQVWCMHVCMLQVCISACTHVRIQVWCTHVCMLHVCISTGMHVRIHAYMSICIQLLCVHAC